MISAPAAIVGPAALSMAGLAAAAGTPTATPATAPMAAAVPCLSKSPESGIGVFVITAFAAAAGRVPTNAPPAAPAASIVLTVNNPAPDSASGAANVAAPTLTACP